MSPASAEAEAERLAATERAIRTRLEAVERRISAACERAGRAREDVTLVGVSKKHDAVAAAAGVRAGLVELGENFAQEARDKQPLVHGLLADASAEGMPRFRWRMIGGLQRNKARLAARIFDAVDTVDRIELAEELSRRAEALDRRLEICLQVNISDEPQKGGVAPDELAPLLEACRKLGGVRVAGLMTIPAASSDPERTRPAFARLRELRDTLWSDFEDREGHSLRTLSMGMSSDFEVAIEEGATHIRVGTALFGARPAPPQS